MPIEHFTGLALAAPVMLIVGGLTAFAREVRKAHRDRLIFGKTQPSDMPAILRAVAEVERAERSASKIPRLPTRRRRPPPGDGSGD